jgi:hypothetical protein
VGEGPSDDYGGLAHLCINENEAATPLAVFEGGGQSEP